MVKVYRIQGSDFTIKEKTVACIGYFDAIHKGHQELINRTLLISREKGLKPGIIFFEPDPSEIISGRKVGHLFSLSERKKIMSDFGIEVLMIINFDQQMMKMPPDDFIRNYLNKMNIDTLICGYDFSFGYLGKGNHDLLESIGHFSTVSVGEVSYYGNKISSSRIRKEFLQGNFRLVKRLLGFEYYQYLKILKCQQNGVKWHIQAICKDKDLVSLKDGAYSDGLEIRDGIFCFDSDLKLGEDSIYKYIFQ